MSLPNFLQPSSPPRSPHVARPGYFDNMYPSATPRAPIPLRPTRRDVLLCLVTLSFSYLLFSSPGGSEALPAPNGASSKYRMPWTSLWGSEKSRPDVRVSSETTYTESVRGHGLQAIDESPKDDTRWDGGEEEEEDDTVFPGETKLLAHQPGWTMFDKLYVYNGSFYVVT